MLGGTKRCGYINITSPLTWTLLKKFNLHMGKRFGCTWYPQDSFPSERNIANQLFPKHHYLDGGWIVAITDLPVIGGERLKMRDYYQMIMNAKRDGEFGPYDIEVKHYGLSAGEMTHALEHIFNLAPEKAKAAYKTADVEFLKDGAF